MCGIDYNLNITTQEETMYSRGFINNLQEQLRQAVGGNEERKERKRVKKK
jgi:hypothetical protein